MNGIRFDWDEQKALTNERKHGIAFAEAEPVFYDKNARLIFDPEHSLDEQRYIILGMSNLHGLLVVSHAYKQNDQIIRIISARKATKREQQQYREFL